MEHFGMMDDTQYLDNALGKLKTYQARDFYVKRNAEIRRKHQEGKNIAELADEFALSMDSIRRILYR